jgi:hypothetical protein
MTVVGKVESLWRYPVKSESMTHVARITSASPL